MSQDLNTSKISSRSSNLSEKSEQEADWEYLQLINEFSNENQLLSTEESEFLKRRLDSNLNGYYMKILMCLLKEKRIFWKKPENKKIYDLLSNFLKYKSFKSEFKKTFFIFKNLKKGQKIAKFLKENNEATIFDIF